MKRAILVIGMLLAFDVQAAAVFDSGQDLFKNCSQYEKQLGTPPDWACMAYVTAVADVLSNNSVGGVRVCFPQNVNKQQVVLVVVKYLRDQPEVLHFSAVSLTVNALQKAFPCSK